MCGLWPNLKTDSYRAVNRTGTLKLKAMKKYSWFYSFKNPSVAENYLFFITTKRFRDTDPIPLRSHKVWFPTETSENSSCPMCGYILEDEVHVLFKCPTYVQIRQKYDITEPVNQPNWSHVRNKLTCEDEPKLITCVSFLY